ncbi:PQQ-binding-like beta-propeller repeat protein [Aquihabitans sp. G128]|uniref:outer membrane protein assembly factor BamB family protein n=1 Tax=Aquihabitans sp. G128 TaxID=2849779 RepID=UPI001C22715F|nr:PQQ-binding-like beta-propeller repeat protein [Aquihabitans sp. G128]QXC62298.1 PQQ-binding-like beta-propeller repeat protein [Aquihabitans sp. G128]
MVVALVGYLALRDVPLHLAAPTVADQGCGNGAPGGLVALDGRTGALRWSERMGAADQLLASTGAVVAPGGDDVRAVSPTDGLLGWCGEMRSGNGLDAVLVGDSIVAVTTEGIVARKARDGGVAWQRPGEWFQLTASGDVALAARIDGKALVTEALDPTTGATRWTREDLTLTVPEQDPSPTYGDAGTGLTYLNTGRGVVAVDRQGKDRWRSSAGELRHVSASGIVLARPGTSPTAVASDLRLVVLDPATGAERWNRVFPAEGVAAFDDVLVVQGRSASDPGDPAPTRFTAVRASDGSRLWTRTVEAGFGARAVGDVVLVERLFSGGVVALDQRTGSTVWRADPGNPGRSREFRDHGGLVDAASDPSTGTVFLLYRADVPYRD